MELNSSIRNIPCSSVHRLVINSYILAIIAIHSTIKGSQSPRSPRWPSLTGTYELREVEAQRMLFEIALHTPLLLSPELTSADIKLLQKRKTKTYLEVDTNVFHDVNTAQCPRGLVQFFELLPPNFPCAQSAHAQRLDHILKCD